MIVFQSRMIMIINKKKINNKKKRMQKRRRMKKKIKFLSIIKIIKKKTKNKNLKLMKFAISKLLYKGFAMYGKKMKKLIKYIKKINN